MRKLVANLISKTRRSGDPAFPGSPSKGTALAVIGDVHGYSDLFRQIIARIEQRSSDLSPDRLVIVQVGDMIDRGPDSAGCLDIAVEQSARRDIEFVPLLGNHEVFLRLCLRSNEDCLDHVADWLMFGGRQTVDSLLDNIPCPPLPDVLNDPVTFRRNLQDALEGARMELLENMRSHYRDGSVLISHAGFPEDDPVDEVLALSWDDVSPGHWAWTREPSEISLSFQGQECGIVHGHSIHQDARPVGARFPVDTGIYRSGRLSAALFFDDSYEVLEVS
ncbi:metallophosphoesterase [Aestuariispira ectoiniformans]|uniref:metallophosphoesterase n=1 Tax=Aestuariispira ectoiniformans TaxID=2775080 RepID=UPI00223A6F53|nr:metallophosphoesterase [Aestuariispira ectoiniformans]